MTTSLYRRTFTKSHTFLPVVHVKDTEQALRNARIAQDGGADGIFLVDHEVRDYSYLLDVYGHVRENMPDFWIGLNCLSLGQTAIEKVRKDLAGLWVDNAGVHEDEPATLAAERFAVLRVEVGWQGIYFGGVAFKYQKPVRNVALVARRATAFMDVITTSGPGTGEAADVEKIRLMKEAIGDHPLAIASGITPENVRDYMPYVDCFLVATGISHSYTELNLNRVQQLASILSD